MDHRMTEGWLRSRRISAVALLAAFVADGPQDDGRMVAVAADQGHEVLFRPFVEEFRITVLLLRDRPGICKFIHYQETHPVAQVQELRRRGIVGGTDGVAAHVLEHLEAAHPGVVVPDGAERARVVVQAHALQENLVLVEVETVGLPFRAADAERGFVGVKHFVRRFHRGAGDIHRGTVRGPEAGAREVEGLPDRLSVLDILDAAGFGQDAVHDHLLPVAV